MDLRIAFLDEKGTQVSSYADLVFDPTPHAPIEDSIAAIASTLMRGLEEKGEQIVGVAATIGGKPVDVAAAFQRKEDRRKGLEEKPVQTPEEAAYFAKMEEYWLAVAAAREERGGKAGKVDEEAAALAAISTVVDAALKDDPELLKEVLAR